MDQVRKDHWMRVKNMIPHSTLFHATAKFPYKDNKYYVSFPDEASVTKALEALLSDPERLHWDDTTYQERRKVYCKRHREYADLGMGVPTGSRLSTDL